jgi:hypothetical protein
MIVLDEQLADPLIITSIEKSGRSDYRPQLPAIRTFTRL